jgi:hypothetical protein
MRLYVLLFYLERVSQDLISRAEGLLSGEVLLNPIEQVLWGVIH